LLGVPEIICVSGLLGVANAPLIWVEREGPDPDAEVEDDVAVPQFPHLSVGQAERHPFRAEGIEGELDRSADAVEGLDLVLDLGRVQYAKKSLIASRGKSFEFGFHLRDEDVAVELGLNDEHAFLIDRQDCLNKPLA